MGQITFDIAKGRVVELYARVKNNDPATSALGVMLLAATGLEGDGILEGKFTIADMLLGSTNEATNTGYSRKILTDATLPALPLPDIVNHRRRLPLPDQTWTAVANDGTGTIGKLVVYYDPDPGTSTDATRVPITAHDFVKTPDGNDIPTEVDINGFFEATRCTG